MSGHRNDHNDLDSSDSAVDFDLLREIQRRLCNDERFRAAHYRPDYAPSSVVFHLDLGFYPMKIEEAKLKIKWFENGDFSIHYQENYTDGTKSPGQEPGFSHRWGRHPNPHNTYDHIHPGPDAPDSGDDADHASDWNDVLSMVICEVDERRDSFWS